LSSTWRRIGTIERERILQRAYMRLHILQGIDEARVPEIAEGLNREHRQQPPARDVCVTEHRDNNMRPEWVGNRESSYRQCYDKVLLYLARRGESFQPNTRFVSSGSTSC
jgi:hypothetical protein